MTTSSPVIVFTGNPGDAAIITSMLDSVGIRAMTMNAALTGLRPDMMLAVGGVKLVVAARDEAKARQIVDDFYANLDDDTDFDAEADGDEAPPVGAV